MALIRCLASFGADTAFPEDRVTNTVYFTQTGAPFLALDYQTMADDLNEAFMGNWYGDVTTARECLIKLYDMADPEPRPIKASSISHPGAAPTSGCPREVALCLSFYAERNLPKTRGRIFLFVPAALASPGQRPSDALATRALGLATALGDIGGVNVDWVVYSPTDEETHSIEHAWVDDEWDTMRSRGLGATKRSTVGLSE